ncbi:MAG: hypothetical protein ATN33_05820 [Epulopiscium sp. Nele67-Bin001]|nr:MAG: hypothetical protein ATN33_05820 [Epulopiscium sp. Nele67-Bin001]
MQLNIQTLINEPEVEFDETVEVDLKDANLGSEQTTYPARVYGKITRLGNNYIVRGAVDTTVKLMCGRCLDEVDYNIHANLFNEFSSDLTYCEDEVILVKGTIIDLSDSILEAILLELPFGFVCNEDCLGICKVCGTNRNIDQCDCNQSVIDLRLEQFKDIFSEV